VVLFELDCCPVITEFITAASASVEVDDDVYVDVHDDVPDAVDVNNPVLVCED